MILIYVAFYAYVYAYAEAPYLFLRHSTEAEALMSSSEKTVAIRAERP